MKVIPCMVRGEKRWKIELPGGGKRKRLFFQDPSDAEKALKDALKDHADLGRAWGKLAAREKADIMQVLKEIADAGFTLHRVWEMVKTTPNAPKASRTLRQAIDETIEVKTKAKRREDYVKGLRLYLNAFAKGRESLDIGQIGVSDIEHWFDSRGEQPRTRRSNLGRLAAMFDLCWRRRYIPENPCWRVESVSIDHEAPATFTLHQSARAILWARLKCPKALAWLTLTLFLGLRPKAEADKLGWNKIDLKKKRVTVDGKSTKIRHHRIMDLSFCPVGLAWLKVAKKIGSPLPLPHGTRRRYIRQLSKYLKLKKWPQDILRHTAASNLLAFHQDAGKVAYFLANSAGTLLRDYKALTFKEDAQKFMKLLPKPRHLKD